MSISDYKEIIEGPCRTYGFFCQQIGGLVATQGTLTEHALQAQLEYIILAKRSKNSFQLDEQLNHLQPTRQFISAVQDIRERNRVSPYFNHLSAVSEGIAALGWVTVSPHPVLYVSQANDVCQFYTNRIVKHWKDTDKKHIHWVKAWTQTLSDLQDYVKHWHSTGLIWSCSGVPCSPMSYGDIYVVYPENKGDPLFEFDNHGDNITKNLDVIKESVGIQTQTQISKHSVSAKHVPSKAIGKSLKKRKQSVAMQTRKTLALQNKSISTSNSHESKCTLIPVPIHIDAGEENLPIFTKVGGKWFIENQNMNYQLIEHTETDNTVHIFNCTDTTVVVKGTINSIIVDSCKKMNIIFDSVEYAIGFTNCRYVEMQVLGKVPTIFLDNTDRCKLYLSLESLDAEVITLKSAEITVFIPRRNGGYTKHIVPEQYKTVVTSVGVKTKVIRPRNSSLTSLGIRDGQQC